MTSVDGSLVQEVFRCLALGSGEVFYPFSGGPCDSHLSYYMLPIRERCMLTFYGNDVYVGP